MNCGWSTRLRCVPTRLVEFKQDLESDHISSKSYLELANSECKSFRRGADRCCRGILRQPPRKIAVGASGRNIADVVRRNRQPGLAFMALKGNRPNLFQPHHNLSFEGHVAELYHGEARSLLSRLSHRRPSPFWIAAACESPCRAIHPEMSRCGIEGLRPGLPKRQRRGTFRTGSDPRVPKLGCQASNKNVITMFQLKYNDYWDLLPLAHHTDPGITPGATIASRTGAVATLCRQ
jgi:hypothetical protein